MRHGAMPAKSRSFNKVKQKFQLEAVPSSQKLARSAELVQELKDQLRVARVVTIARGSGLSEILGCPGAFSVFALRAKTSSLARLPP